MKILGCSFRRRFLSIILCLVLLAGLVSPAAKTAYAAEIEPESSISEVEYEEPVATYVQDKNLFDETIPDVALPVEGEEPLTFDQNNTSHEAAIMSEDADRKDLYTKDFLLEDMTRLLVVYPDAVHFQKDGKWIDIDNTLELARDEKTGNPIYKNRANSVEITLPEALSLEEGPRVTYGKDSIRFVFAGITVEKHEKTEEMVSETEESLTSEETETIEKEESLEAELAETEEVTSELAKAEEITEAAVNDESLETEISTETESETETDVEVTTEEIPEVVTEDIPEPVTEVQETEETIETVGTEISETTLPSEDMLESVESTESTDDINLLQKLLIPIHASSIEVNESPIPEKELAEMSERQQQILPLKLFSEAVYREVLPGTDVRYDLNSTTLKESIVLNRVPETVTSYVFYLFSDSLDFRLNRDNTISAVGASGEEIFTIPAPFAYDAAEETSHDVKVTLEKIDRGYELIITPDYRWLSSPERVYPVIIDPSVFTTQIRENIKDMAVASKGGNNYNDDYLEAGYHLTRGKERIFIKFAALPKLSAADVIIDANLMLYRGTNVSDTLQINAHKVNAIWESNTITWANQPSYNTTITDYAKVSSNGWYEWSITEIARDWFEGSAVNTGVMLKAPDATENGTTRNNRTFYSSDSSLTNRRPILTITYINNCGYESYWDYDSYDLGRAGTAGVNLFTGNMVLQRTDLAFSGNRMPVSVNFTYNTNDKVSLNSSGSIIAGGTFGLGNGWRTNYNQRVYLYTPSDGTSTGSYTYYVWEDEDGTRHYFRGESATGTFKDESGIELTLTNTGSGDSKFVITDKNNNKSYFDTSGRLKKISNNQATVSNILVTYRSSGNTNAINTITDGAGRVYQFNYNSSGYLTNIQYKGTGSSALSTVTYSISSAGNLCTVTYADSTIITYDYSSYAMTKVSETFSGSSARTLAQLTYSTQSNTLPNRLSSIKIFDESGGSATSTNTYAYGKGYTLATDMNGNVLQYQFNKYGNTVSTQDKQGRAVYAKYATDTDDSAKKNQLKHASKLQSTTNNVFKNPSFERNEFWYSAIPSDGTGTVGYTSEDHYLGEDCFKLTKTSGNLCSWVYAGNGAGVVLKPNTTYTFTVYVKGVGVTDSNGIYICGTVNGVQSAVRTGTTDGWQRFEVTVDTPSTVSTCNFYVALYGNGTAYVDCMQLEENGLSSRFNLIENSDFTYYNGTTDVCYAWSEGSACVSTEKRMSLSSGLIGAKNIDNNVYTMTGAVTERKRAYQDIPGSGAAGDVYSIGGWAKGNAAPVKSGSYANDNLFAIVLRFYNTDGTQSEFRADFNPDLYENDTWQYACEKVVAPKAYSSMRVLLVYERNVNTIYYDAIQLYKDEFGSSYVYDSNGNVTSVTDSRKQQNNYEYSNNNLTKATLHDGAVYNYGYDNYHNVTTATSATGTQNSFSYDAYGNNTKVQIVDTNNSAVIESQASYSNYGNTLSKVTDSINKEVEYNYNNNSGMLMSSNGNGTTTTYSYDNIYRLISASRNYEGGTATINYNYLNDHMTGITYGGTNSLSYGLTYGTFGQLTKVTAGGTTLVTNSYTYNSSTNPYYDLSSVVYGNGARVDYSYDSLGNLTSKKYDSDSSTTVTYFYDNEGKLGKVYDDVQDLTHKYIYDISGRLISDTESGWRSFTTTYGYDTNDNVSKIKDKIWSVTYENNYSFDADNRPTSSSSGSASQSITYDQWGRKSSETVKHGNTTVVSTSITYYQPSTGKTSLLPDTYNNDLNGSNDKNFTYTYDSNGNIEGITDGDGKHRSYQYDKLGQLIRENDEISGNTWVFNYDTRGNITSKVRYAYTTASTLGTALETIPYTYQSSGWKDILTSVGSTSYTNDAIGNRLSDGTWTYTWEHGRQLASMSKSGTSIAYGYDADGQRIYKNVTEGSTTTKFNYYYRNGNLIDALWGSNRIHIFYDASGSPVSIAYNGTQYYYVKNVQGDVVGLTNTSGILVVSYEYDAWGKLLSITGSAASTVGQANPLRYRGYVYDTEIGLYYLGSRYYDPGVGRFISADDPQNLGITGDNGCYNLFTYCGNNPIDKKDEEGEWAHVVIGAVLGAAFELGSQLHDNGGDLSSVNWTKVGIATAVGGASAACGPFVGAIISGVGNCLMAQQDGVKDKGEMRAAFIIGFGSSLIGAGIGECVTKIGGAIAIKQLSQQSGGTIKKVVTKAVEVAGADRNLIKKATSEAFKKCSNEVGRILIGKAIPQVFNSFVANSINSRSMRDLYATYK